MEDMNALILKKALNILKTLKAEYKIILPDGTQYGELKIEVKGSGRLSDMWKAQNRKRGDLSKYASPFVDKLNPGESVMIPYDKFTPESLIGSVAARASHSWGIASHTTHRTKEGVILMRLAKESN